MIFKKLLPSNTTFLSIFIKAVFEIHVLGGPINMAFAQKLFVVQLLRKNFNDQSGHKKNQKII